MNQEKIPNLRTSLETCIGVKLSQGRSLDIFSTPFRSYQENEADDFFFSQQIKIGQSQSAKIILNGSAVDP